LIKSPSFGIRKRVINEGDKDENFCVKNKKIVNASKIAKTKNGERGIFAFCLLSN